MKIADSQVTMGSARQYMQMGNSANRKKEGGFLQFVSESSESNYQYKNQEDYKIPDSYSSSLEGTDPVKKIQEKTINGNNSEQAARLQYSLLNLLMHRLFYSYMSNGVMSITGGGLNQRAVTYEEYEDSAFYAQGQAITEDGRQIDFNVDVWMSRSYMEYMDMPIMQLGNALCDPLVIHLDSSYTQISDQKFRFDLDADGTEESISMPGKGNGFLALDINNDGVINDGSELFGTKSGDGFADLKAYDSDGNGWIDENDEVFDRLKVWCKGDNGEDILMNLKEADIGAIFLGAKETEYSMYGNSNNLNGVIRSTGFFLKESGSAGTIQQMDLAKDMTSESKKTAEQTRNNSRYSINSLQSSDPINRIDSRYASEYSGILTFSGLNRNISTNTNEEGNRETRQYQTNQRIAREREEKNYRTRTARNRRLQEERIARQRNQRKIRKQEEEELLYERQLQEKKEEKAITEEQIGKLLEDRAFSFI
ncbi:MAG: hypothetical protein IJ079_08870 [Lachnospiraceae bacterium]|nr:hypothetical protein [Lachnospiraceae bacterium]